MVRLPYWSALTVVIIRLVCETPCMSGLSKFEAPPNSIPAWIGALYSKWDPILQVVQTSIPLGPKFIQMRHIINLQKGGTGMYVLALMYYFNNWGLGAWMYLANHGTYGLLWLLKDQTIPDVQWQQRVTLPSALVVGLVLAGYWSGAYSMIKGRTNVSLPRAALCTAIHTAGCVLMMCADAQKHYTLQLKKGLISDGFLSRCRNTNYLGEMMIYGSYCALSQSRVMTGAVGSVWLTLFLNNMLKKEHSIARKDGGAEYMQRSGLLFPDVWGWLSGSGNATAPSQKQTAKTGGKQD